MTAASRRSAPLVVIGSGPGGLAATGDLVRDLASGERLRELAATPRRVVVIGSGFIGCEAAASLAVRGATWWSLGRTSRTVPPRSRCGEAASGLAARRGVELITGSPVSRIERSGDGWRVHREGSRRPLPMLAE